MTLTAIVVTGMIITLAIYDLIVVCRGGVQSSVSRFMQRSSLKSPVVAFAVGFICGHIFGYMAPEPLNKPDDIQQVESQSVLKETK